MTGLDYFMKFLWEHWDAFITIVTVVSLGIFLVLIVGFLFKILPAYRSYKRK